ncbi:NUDIX hydrolase [Candidatus Saccharibacteria bacterium]|nr:NUDIX hydrolase [Candidatus Saccharibacteria bacterium]
MKTVAKALIYDSNDNMLVLKRSESHPYFAHQDDLPGGEIEPGEDSVTGLIREILEETGMIIARKSVVFASEVLTKNNGSNQLYTVRLSIEKPVIDISWEHMSYQWVTCDLIEQNLITADSYMLIARAWLSK